MKIFPSLLIHLLVLICSTFILSCSNDNDIQSKKILPQSAIKFETGNYTHGSFKSKERGHVDFNVYLPPNWSKDNTEEYGLMILLHGQGEDEFTFLGALPASSLNHWIKQQFISDNFVLIAVRGGTNTNKMQWYSNSNEAMITSLDAQELRRYCHRNFHTSLNPSKISVLGHSRGATGALNFALYFPNQFASVVSSAFVSDYAVERLQQAANQNLEVLLQRKVPIYMLIGENDQYVLNNKRKGSPNMSTFFHSKGIEHQFKVVPKKSHRLAELWEYPTNINCLKFCLESWQSQ
ncbi:esterase family protein [Aureispira sp. CCB-QB1]|uniref:alpha/beta hydrolase n=1 Tax=Aureispira sp. CCB-QB1 TaxID=1313421 RepID=UPI000698E234|nr:alpha/beta hydrolase-fold protein [Aureispira sp. CCB-QB1]